MPWKGLLGSWQRGREGSKVKAIAAELEGKGQRAEPCQRSGAPRESCAQCGSDYCARDKQPAAARGCPKRTSASETVTTEDESLTSTSPPPAARKGQFSCGGGQQKEVFMPEGSEQPSLWLGADDSQQLVGPQQGSSNASSLMQVDNHHHNNAEKLARLRSLVGIILSENSFHSPSEEVCRSQCSPATAWSSRSDHTAQMLSEGLKSVLKSLKEESVALLNESEPEALKNPESTASSVLKLLGELEILLMARTLSDTENQDPTGAEPEGARRCLAGDPDTVSKMAGDSPTKPGASESKNGTSKIPQPFTSEEPRPKLQTGPKPSKPEKTSSSPPAGNPQCRPQLKGSGHSTSSCDNAWQAKSGGGGQKEAEGGRPLGKHAGIAWELKVSSSSSQESWERGQGKSVSTLEEEDWRASKQEALKGLSGSQQMIETLKAAQQEVRSLPDHQLKKLLAKYLGEGEDLDDGHCLCCPLHPKNTKTTLFKDYLYLLRSYGFYMGRFDPTPIPGQPDSGSAVPEKARGEGDNAVKVNSSEDSSTLWSTAESFTSVSSVNKPKSKTRMGMTSSMIKSLENFLRHKKKNKTSNSQPGSPSKKDPRAKDASETDQQDPPTSDHSQSQILLQQDSETTAQGEKHGGKYMSPEFKRAAEKFILCHQGRSARTSSVHISQGEKGGLSGTSYVHPRDAKDTSGGQQTAEGEKSRDTLHDLFVESLKQLEGGRGEKEAQSPGAQTSAQGSQRIKLQQSSFGRKIPTKVGGRWNKSDASSMGSSSSPTNREKSLDRQGQTRGLGEVNRRSPTDGKRPESRAMSGGNDRHKQNSPESRDLSPFPKSAHRESAGSQRLASLRSRSQSRKGKKGAEKEHSKPLASLSKINHYFSRMRDSGNETSQTENSSVYEMKTSPPSAQKQKSGSVTSDTKASDERRHPVQSPLTQPKTSAHSNAGLGSDGHHSSPASSKLPSPSSVTPRLSRLPKAAPTSGSGLKKPEHSKATSSPTSSMIGDAASSLKRHSVSAVPVSNLSGPNCSEQSGITLSPTVSTPQLLQGVSQESALESLCSVTTRCSPVPMFYSAWPCPIPVPCTFVSSTQLPPSLPSSQTLLPVAHGADCMLGSHPSSPLCSRSMQGLYMTSPQPRDVSLNSWAASFQAQNPACPNLPPSHNLRSQPSSPHSGATSVSPDRTSTQEMSRLRHVSQSPVPRYSQPSPSSQYPLETSSTGSSLLTGSAHRTQSVSPSRIPIKKAYSTLSKCIEPVKRAFSASPRSHSSGKLHSCLPTTQTPKPWSQYFFKAAKQDSSVERGVSSQWRSSLCNSPVLVSRSKATVSPACSDPPVMSPCSLPFSTTKSSIPSAKSSSQSSNLASDLKRFFGAGHKSQNDGAARDKGARSIKSPSSWSKTSAFQYSVLTKEEGFTDALDKCQSSSQSLQQFSPPPTVWFATKAERSSRSTKRSQGATKIPRGEKRKELRQPAPKGPSSAKSVKPKFGSASRFAEGRRHGSEALGGGSDLPPRKEERRRSKVMYEGSTTLASASPMSPGLAIRYKAFMSGSVDYENLLFDCFK